jgi:hypothetical protein
MKQERVTRVRPQKTEPDELDDVIVEESETALLSDIDELLDEIDAVLEDQSTLVNFRQRSGQ